jgi:hypothetical protein
MENLKSMKELIQIAEESGSGLEEHKLRADAKSRRGQFPYQFSYCGPDDRYNGEFSEEEVRKLSEDPDMASVIRHAFVIKMALESAIPRITNF